MSEQVVTEVVHEALGETPVSVEHVPTLEGSHVYRVELPSGAVFFKSEHEGHPIDVAAWAYTKAATVGVPVPEVLHLDLSRERWPEEFMIVSAVPGTDLQHDPLEGDSLAAVLEGYGALLRRLHSIELEGFGDLEFQDAKVGDPIGPFDDHASSIRRGLDWSLPYVIEKRLLSADRVSLIEEILVRNDEIVSGPARGVFLHDDPGLDHLFVDRSSMRITGLIDFEPKSGDPAWDPAVFAYHYPDLAGHLYSGYGPLPDDFDDRLVFYGLLRAVGCARWEHEQGMNIEYPLAQIESCSTQIKALLA